MPTLYLSAKVQVLSDRHAQVTVTPRLTYITKALKTKAVNRLIAVYAGFPTANDAELFLDWVKRNWDKTEFDLEMRPGKRTASAWEVKVRKPTEAQLATLIERARLHPPSQPAPAPVLTGHIPADAPLLPRRSPTRSKSGLSID